MRCQDSIQQMTSLDPLHLPMASRYWKASLYWVWAQDNQRKHRKAFQITPTLLSAEVLLSTERKDEIRLKTWEWTFAQLFMVCEAQGLMTWGALKHYLEHRVQWQNIIHNMVLQIWNLSKVDLSRDHINVFIKIWPLRSLFGIVTHFTSYGNDVKA